MDMEMEVEQGRSNLDSQQNNRKYEYTSEQLEFIYAPKNRDIKITACAGSGKTQCVLEFTKQATKEGLNPKEICITTFNIQASNDMKKKAFELIGKELADNIEISNFDKIITKFYKMIQQVKTKNDQINQNDNLKIEKMTLIEKQYQLLLDLQDISLSKKIFDSFKLIIFDEFQDINQLQYEILMLFKKIGNSTIVVVGDDAQNIYEFRGSDYRYLKKQIVDDINKENKRIYGNEKCNMLELKLTTNFRCSSNITAFANDIIKSFKYIQQNTMQSFEDLKTHSIQKCLTKPTLEPKKSYGDLFRNINEGITSKVKNEGYSYEDFAVISATSYPLRQIEQRLEQHNFNQPENEIPFWSFVGKSKDFDYNFDYKGNKVTLLTVHKSKGLQWKVLFFIGLSDDQFPEAFLRSIESFDNKIEEARRLFYVGSTRAAQILYLSYCSNNYRKACRFLSSVDKINITLIGGAQIAQEKVSVINYENKQLFAKQIKSIFEDMSNPQHIDQLKSAQKYLQDHIFQQENVEQVHRPMFQKNNIQKIFFNQSEEILFTYIETIIIRIMIEKTQINYKSLILNEQINQLQNMKSSLQIQEGFIGLFQQSINQFLRKDLSINKNEELILSIYKTCVLFEISKSKVYKYLFQKNPFYSITKKMIQLLGNFVEYLNKEEKTDLLVLDRIEYSDDPINIYEYFVISSQETLYEVTQSFKKTKILEKQDMLTVILYFIYSLAPLKIYFIFKVLAKVTILKLQYHRDIKKIKFYNPIKGTVFSISISNWMFHRQLIDFIQQFSFNQYDSQFNTQNILSKNQSYVLKQENKSDCNKILSNKQEQKSEQIKDENIFVQFQTSFKPFQDQKQQIYKEQISMYQNDEKQKLIHNPQPLKQQKEVSKKLKSERKQLIIKKDQNSHPQSQN